MTDDRAIRDPLVRQVLAELLREFRARRRERERANADERYHESLRRRGYAIPPRRRAS
jgi:hypothetical protein